MKLINWFVNKFKNLDELGWALLFLTSFYILGVGTGVVVYQHYSLNNVEVSQTCSVTEQDLQACGDQLMRCDVAYQSWMQRANELKTMLVTVMNDCSNYQQQGD